ncbi:unnamed protein product [Cuscuta europaea]|uniref:glutathione transferase n=1 Tax=Cuscuta europaea TaxID=41803 RepID=A0A9P1E533_CUSEU|nr:unnamed protein product [Cuscuta europaea]
MALKVHGILLSPALLKVIACLEEKELDYELVSINFSAGEHKKQPFLRLNPFGQVPAIEDGDLILFESRAITQYISHTYIDRGSHIVPLDHKEKAIMSVWIEVEAHQFDVAACELHYELIIRPMLGMVINDVAVAPHKETLTKVLDIYEERLKVSQYLAGDSFTLADLYHTPLVHSLMGTKVKILFKARPHVAAWVSNLLSRPAWSKVQDMIEQDINKAC